MTAVLTTGEIPGDDELRELYDSVGWSTYTGDIPTLRRGLEGSARVVTGRDAGVLVGMARIVSDGATIAYLQDVLVHPRAQRTGLGRRLVEAAFEPYSHIRQHVLLTDDEPRQRFTDDEPRQRSFYESLGFAEIRDIDSGSLRAFVRMR